MSLFRVKGMNRVFFTSIFILFSSFGLYAQGECYYVSSSKGSNDNDGMSELSPKKDLTEVPKKNVTIRLKCDDVFFGGVSGYNNCIIESYGKGNRPVICGFKVLVNTSAWKSLGNELWELDLTRLENFRGNTESVQDEAYNNIGFIYNPKDDKLYGRNKESVVKLEKDMDFYTSSYYSKKDINDHPFKSIIIKYSGNPSELGNLCFPMYQIGISSMINCELKRVAVVGFSYMGIAYVMGCKVDDCQIDMIGGAIQVGYGIRARFGNGIEFWDGFNDNIVTNCLISRTYDCATTIQANGIINDFPRNNQFIGNRIYKCRQAFEHFINPSDGSVIQYDNCEFSNNICYLMGDNEFDCPEKRDCNILSYENKTKSITIRNNTFFGSNHISGSSVGKGMKGNTVYVYNDQYIYTQPWDNPLYHITGNREDAVESYRKIIHDDSRIVVLQRGGLRAYFIGNRIKRKIGWKPVNLHLERIIN